MRGAGVRAPSLSGNLGGRVRAEVQGDENDHGILHLFLLVVWIRWLFTCHAHRVGAQEGKYTMTVHRNRGVEGALETATVVDFSNLVNVVEAETVRRLSSTLQPVQFYQDRP